MKQKKLFHKTAIITGASEGLGLVIAEHFIKAGANVVICARNKNKLDDALAALIPLCEENKVIAITTDISSEIECNYCAKTTLDHFGKINILINNAGIHGAKGPVDEVDWDEWESAIDINLKGTVLMTRAVLSHMKKNHAGKIIMLSGGGATKPMPNMSAYAASKAAIVRFSETLADEVREFKIDVNAIAPGALNTRLLQDVLQAGPKLIGEKYYNQILAQQKNGGNDIHRAAALCEFLASDESNGISGKLISAIWDPWEKLSDHHDELMTSDIYTLRRIIPEDRNKKWDV
ncbi:MAG TPA: SDR family oxidoreductase [Coxiellaceae bacterium]|nr:MAG: dehydrogenase [Gammaproteobacteria bacterium RIFCSPHIGHO2_12_FULL_36_30]HLB55899.1 SDR family oxidoreductase [Coxiellaceae bacterium]